MADIKTQNIDPQFLAALRLDSKEWAVGEKPVRAFTESGACYSVDSEGKVSGGSKRIRGGRLVGSVYRANGPIRVQAIVVGLRMEIACGDKCILTTAVEKLEVEAPGCEVK